MTNRTQIGGRRIPGSRGNAVSLRLAAIAVLVTLAACSAGKAPAPHASTESTVGHVHEHGHDLGTATCTERFHDVKHWKRIFDDPARAEWQKPSELIAAIAIRPGMRVADVGAGTGFFLRYLSDAVGPSGRVVAVEVETNLISHMKDRAQEEGLDNVEVVLTPLDRLTIGDRSIDVLLLVDAYHHIDKRIEYFRAAGGTLARNGRIAIVDWKPGDLPRGPRDEEHKIAAEVVEREMTAAGYRLVAAPDILPYQYVLVFARPDGTIPAR